MLFFSMNTSGLGLGGMSCLCDIYTMIRWHSEEVSLIHVLWMMSCESIVHDLLVIVVQAHTGHVLVKEIFTAR